MTKPKTLDYEPAPPSGQQLVPTMGLAALVVYGVGDMLGTGIYALIGAAAGEMGNMVWLAFLTSMLAAMFTGLSYASLGSRYPKAAGAAYVTQRAFGWPLLSYTVGLTSMASGLTSMAAATRGFADYFQNFIVAPPWAIIVVFIAILTLVNFWGMRQSTWMNLLCTTIEVAGLVFVIAVGARYWGSVNYLDARTAGNPTGALTPLFVLQGAVLTFYSFIGFEDMINVTEEVKDVRRTFPKGLIIAVLITTIVYMTISITAVSVVPSQDLATEKADATRISGPLVKVVATAAPWMPPKVFAAVALFAIANTALLNYIMGSRLVYGMSRQGLLPGILGRVHPTRRTPHIAIGVLLVIVTILALSGDIRQLASATSLLLLTVFVIVNLSMLVLRNKPGEPRGELEMPAVVPILGMLICLGMIGAGVYRVWGSADGWKAPVIAGAILLIILSLYLILRPRRVVEGDSGFAETQG